MKLWNWIEKITGCFAKIDPNEEIVEFEAEWGIYQNQFPSTLKCKEERECHKLDLIATYTYQEGDDVLAKKQDFIDQYTINEREQLAYFTGFDRMNFPRCKAWRDHEQVERSFAQHEWQEVVYRNQRDHMLQRFRNQKTR